MMDPPPSEIIPLRRITLCTFHLMMFASSDNALRSAMSSATFLENGTIIDGIGRRPGRCRISLTARSIAGLWVKRAARIEPAQVPASDRP